MRFDKAFLGAAALAVAALATPAPAQQFPVKPVKVITPFPAGSGPDAALRIVGDKLGRAWGQQVIVENRPGANGFIAIEAAKKAAADGYTLVQMDSAQLTAHPYLYQKLPYDPVADFEPVSPLSATTFSWSCRRARRGRAWPTWSPRRSASRAT